MTPTLVVLSGLPGTGKSTVATLLIRALRTPYLRIDTIEQALVDSDELPNRPAAAGYLVGYALAEEQLRLGLDVIVECVNPLKVTRDAWAEVATSASASLLEVELICPDTQEHRRRVEHRTVDVAGLLLPTWEQVRERAYEPWNRDHLVVDTFVTSAGDAVTAILEVLRPSP